MKRVQVLKLFGICKEFLGSRCARTFHRATLNGASGLSNGKWASGFGKFGQLKVVDDGERAHSTICRDVRTVYPAAIR